MLVSKSLTLFLVILKFVFGVSFTKFTQKSCKCFVVKRTGFLIVFMFKFSYTVKLIENLKNSQ